MPTVIPAHPGFFLHALWFCLDDELEPIIKHAKHPIVAWRAGEPGKDYTMPIIGGIVDICLSLDVEDDRYVAIEHPDGSFASWTGAWHADFDRWRAEIRRYREEDLHIAERNEEKISDLDRVT